MDRDFPKKLNKLRVTEGDPRIGFCTQLGFEPEACLKQEIREHDLHIYCRSV